MYDPRTDTKSDSARHYLFKMSSMLQHLQINFDFYWDPARDLRIDDKTIVFKCRHKDKLRIIFKDEGDSFRSSYVCDRGYTHYFIYQNDDISDSKHYLCATSERVIWILKHLNTE